jgi:hypothetical protein
MLRTSFNISPSNIIQVDQHIPGSYKLLSFGCSDPQFITCLHQILTRNLTSGIILRDFPALQRLYDLMVDRAGIRISAIETLLDI